MPASLDVPSPARIGCHKFFFRRIELAFPVANPACGNQIITRVLPSSWHDRVKARELLPDGPIVDCKPEGTEPRAQATMWLGIFPFSRPRRVPPFPRGARKKYRSRKNLRARQIINHFPMIVATRSARYPRIRKLDGGENSGGAPSFKRHARHPPLRPYNTKPPKAI